MASSASLKELSKAIIAFLPDPTVPLPEDLSDVIEGYLRRHQKYDDAASDRLQEELLSIFDKHVKESQPACAPWLAILRRLLPALRTPERIFTWWDACAGLMENINPEKDIVNESFGSMMDIINLAEKDGDSTDTELGSNPFINRLFTRWMDRLYPSISEGATANEYNERLVRDALVQFGKRHPKDLFTALDRYFIKKQYRKAVLRFFGEYLQSQPPHLHQILQTPLFGNILRCLRHDASTTVVSAALTALIMLLPHMPSSLVPHLPVLFNIYARLLFWSRENSGSMERRSDDVDLAGNWEVYSFEPDVDDSKVSHLLNYYTILYGLYPLNFMDYIRKPQRYLRHANVASANDIEVQPTEIRDKSERFRRLHLLHPNFYSLTIETEKTDFSRWINSEASEVVAECMGLCLITESSFAISHNLPSIPADTQCPLATEGSSKDGFDPALLSNSFLLDPHDSGRITQSASMESLVSGRAHTAMVRKSSQSSHPSTRDSLDTRNRDSSSDSPTLAAHLPHSSSHTQLQDMIQSNKAIKSGLHQSLTNDSVPSLSLSHQGSIAERPASTMALAPPAISSPLSLTETNTQVATLQRRILLLQNDLSFERYLKQQHMAHIGDLRRKKLEEAVTEAETQNLVMMIRNLKSRLEEAKKAEMQVRRDSERSRTIAKKWEADLANKLKALRDETKKTKAELELTKKELENSIAERQKLRTLVCEAEVKEVNWKQNMQSIEIHATEVDRLKGEVSRLTIAERDYQAKEIERQMAINNASIAEGKAGELRIKLSARENDLERTKKLFQSQVAALQSRLSEYQDGGRQLSARDREVVEKALAASRARQAEVEKQYRLLSRKYTALQSSLLDMKTEASSAKLKVDTRSLSDGDDYLSMSASPVMMKAGLHRVLSSPETTEHEGTSYNITAPLDFKPNLTGPGAWSPHTVVPPGTDGSASLSMSPNQRQAEKRLGTRSHSDIFSGTVQNRIRKDSKDKGKEDGAGKKDKKSSGLRGIRGFV